MQQSHNHRHSPKAHFPESQLVINDEDWHASILLSLYSEPTNLVVLSSTFMICEHDCNIYYISE